MSGTTRLNVPLIAEGQSSKYITHNDGVQAIEDALQGALAVSVSSASQTLNDGQFRSAWLFRVSGAAAGSRYVALPDDIERLVMFSLDSASTYSVDVKVGSNTLTLQPGSSRLVYTDGAGNLTGVIHGAPSGFADLGFSKLGKPTANQVLLYLPLARPLRFPAGLAGGWARSRVAADDSYVVTVSRVIPGTGTTNFGTATWGAGDTDAVLAAATATDIPAGGILMLTAPSTPDATLEDIGFQFVTQRL